jgi:hypothetical protein
VNQATVQFAHDTSDAKLVGIGGWLLLLIIKLLVGTALRVLVGIAMPNHLAGVFNIGFGVLSGTAAFLLINRNRKGVLLAKIFLAAEALYYALELLPPASVDNPFKTCGFAAASVLYFIYLARSKRVKNTYFQQPEVQPALR